MIAYRLLTGTDSSEFCHKITKALNEGWQLYGSPAYAFDAKEDVMKCAQAVTKDVEGVYTPDVKLGAL